MLSKKKLLSLFSWVSGAKRRLYRDLRTTIILSGRQNTIKQFKLSTFICIPFSLFAKAKIAELRRRIDIKFNWEINIEKHIEKAH